MGLYERKEPPGNPSPLTNRKAYSTKTGVKGRKNWDRVRYCGIRHGAKQTQMTEIVPQDQGKWEGRKQVKHQTSQDRIGCNQDNDVAKNNSNKEPSLKNQDAKTPHCTNRTHT